MSRSPSHRMHPRTLAPVAALALVGTMLVTAPADASSSVVQTWLSTSSSTTAPVSQPSISLGAPSDGAVNVRVDDRLRYQVVDGVGASFTDSSAYLLTRLKEDDPAAYAALMTEVFDPDDGLGMTLWRVPMGSSDFTATTTHWTNADQQGPASDPTAYFGLTERDTQYIIPVIRDALTINPGLQIIASPWGAPAWMKTNNSIICHANGRDGSLRPEYHQAWADYFRKWIQAYEAAGVPIWGITPQNEPQYCPNTYPGMKWTAQQQVDWVTGYLAPTLTRAGLDPVILGWDHNFTQSAFAQTVVDKTTPAQIDGIAWHCYDNDADPAYMTKVRNADPGRAVYETECSSDIMPGDIIRFGTAEMALLSFQNWAQGVILWNLALDASGGPHLGGCVGCKPLVRVDEGSPTAWTYHRNLAHLGQISKFVAPGATRIDSTVNAHGIVTAAFENPGGEQALIATNTTSAAVTFRVTWNGQGSFDYTLPSRATVTFTGKIPSDAPLPSTPTVGHDYRIVSRASGKEVGVCGASVKDGACILQWTDSGDPDQRWTLADAGDGYLNIVNVGSAKALDNPNGSRLNGTVMQQWTLVGTGNWNQQWSVTPVGDGWYTIINRTSGKALDVRDGSVSDGASIQQWTSDPANPKQQFAFVPYG